MAIHIFSASLPKELYEWRRFYSGRVLTRRMGFVLCTAGLDGEGSRVPLISSAPI